jgi:PST family polysaccharide transporter
MLRQLQTAFSKLTRSSIARNSAALYGVQLCRKVFPLITIPYLARTLSATGWGTVAFVLSLSELVALIVEFGFNLSATREISQQRDHKEACGEVMSGVLGAQALLACCGVGMALLIAPHIALLRDNPKLVFAGLLYAVAQGCTPLWFFQGLEKMRLAAALEVTAKTLMLAGIFLLVRNPHDGWKVLTLQACAASVSTLSGIALALRSFPLRVPSPSLIHGALKRGWPMFVFRSAESLYGVGNSFLLGLFAAPAIVGYFAAAEKISKAVFGLLNPVREALYPRLSYLAQTARREAAKLARAGIAIMTAAGALLAIGVAGFAPSLMRMIGGSEFGPAVPILRILAALPFVLSITYSVGLQWLLPSGRDRDVNRVILRGGLINLAFSFLLAPRFGGMGMAASVLTSEVFVCISLVWVVYRSTNLWESA